jgi:uncharacterized protein YoxC
MTASFQWAITVFAGVAAMALLVQAFMLVRIYRIARATQQRVDGFVDRAEPLVDTSLKAVDEIRHQARDILGKVQQITDSARGQVARIDDLLVECANRVQAQMDRLDQVVETTMERAEETTAQLQQTILAPVREINAWAAGIRAVVQYLGRRNVSTVEKATQDEEMFI